MCNMPDDVREALRVILLRWAMKHDGNEEVDKRMVTISDWLDAQPTAPMPDWSQAPVWAICGAIDPDGQIVWASSELMYDTTYWFHDHSHYSVDGCCKRGGYVSLPLGCDWRTTLRKRPETDVSELEKQLMPAVSEQEIGKWLE